MKNQRAVVAFAGCEGAGAVAVVGHGAEGGLGVGAVNGRECAVAVGVEGDVAFDEDF